MDIISINTAHNVHIQYKVASLGKRIGAHLLDLLVMAVYFIGFITIFVIFQNPLKDAGNVNVIIFICVIMLPLMFYHLLFEIFDNGRSIGKRAVKIQVVMLDGSQPTLGAYIIRWLFRIIDLDMFNGVIALVVVATNGKGQRLGDIVAGTTVISTDNKMTDNIYNFTTHTVNTDKYTPVFPEAASLSQQQAITIRQTFMQARKGENVELFEKISDIVIEITHIKRPVHYTAEAFVEQVLEDYYNTQST